MTTPLSDNEYLFTSESVTEGHPDKVADQISDGVLDAVLKDDPYGPRRLRDARQHRPRRGLGRDLDRDLRRHPGDRARDDPPASATWTRTSASLPTPAPCSNAIDKQSPDIAQGVDQAYEARTDSNDDDELDVAGAGDQGMMFGYATNETDSAHAAADLARPPPGRAPGRGAQGRDRELPAPGRQDAGVGALQRRQAGRDREAADLHPAQGGRRVADPGRPLGARGGARSCRRSSTTRRSCVATSSSTPPAAS